MGTPLKIAMSQWGKTMNDVIWGNPISRLSPWDLAAKWACTPYEFAAIYTLHVIKKIGLPIQSYVFFHLWTQYLKPLYVYYIYISTVLNVLTPSLCALSSLLSGSADIYKSASSGLLTQIFVTQNVDLLWRRFLSEGQSCQWRHLQMHPRAAGVGTQGYCRWPKWQPGDWNRQAPHCRIEWRNKQSHHQEKP